MIKSLDIDHGETCPTCGQFAKKYRRNLYSAQVLGLIYLVKLYDGDWVHINKVSKILVNRHGIHIGGDFAKLRHWGLIYPAPNDDPKKRCSGLWKPTDKGIEFVHEKVKVRNKIFLYNNKFLSYSGRSVDVIEALDGQFDYEELMK